MLFYYTCINVSNVSCRMELEITVTVAFIISGFSLNFFAFFVLLFQVVNFGLALRCCTVVTVVIELCEDVFPYIVLSSHH